MAFWIELHCDARTSAKCITNAGDTPGEMASNPNSRVAATRKALIDAALAHGWVKLGDKFICPRCKAATN